MVVKTLSVLLHLDIEQHTLSANTSKKPVNGGQNTVCAASSGQKTRHKMVNTRITRITEKCTIVCE